MTTTLQRTMPVYHFHEQHSRLISAPPDVVWQALTTLTLNDLSITRPLIALRNVGGYRTSSAKPLLTNGPTPIFDLDPPRYTIGGSVSRPWQLRPERRTVASIDEFAAFDEPGWVKYLVDFDLTPEGDATRLSTETRGYSTNDHARRIFRFYWAAIRLGSAAVRRDMLASIAKASASRDGLPQPRGDLDMLRDLAGPPPVRAKRARYGDQRCEAVGPAGTAPYQSIWSGSSHRSVHTEAPIWRMLRR